MFVSVVMARGWSNSSIAVTLKNCLNSENDSIAFRSTSAAAKVSRISSTVKTPVAAMAENISSMSMAVNHPRHRMHSASNGLRMHQHNAAQAFTATGRTSRAVQVVAVEQVLELGDLWFRQPERWHSHHLAFLHLSQAPPGHEELSRRQAHSAHTHSSICFSSASDA